MRVLVSPYPCQHLLWRYMCVCEASLMVQMVKNSPAMQETQVQSLGWEGPLEEGMATHSRILAWSIPWTEEPGGLRPTGLQSVRHDREHSTAYRYTCISIIVPTQCEMVLFLMCINLVTLAFLLLPTSHSYHCSFLPCRIQTFS